MAFKAINDYNDARFGGLFVLRDDGDSSEVVFLYRSAQDCLVADTHYIKSADYSGYVHCCGRGCPACSQGIRVQTKIFIPLYDIKNDRILFWDRSIRFEHQLQNDVFSKFPNPCDYVFRITRKGAAGDINTVYEITAIARNTNMPYDAILAKHNIKFPEAYESICRDIPATELSRMIAAKPTAIGTSTESIGMPEYQITPRPAYNASVSNLDAPFNATSDSTHDVMGEFAEVEPIDEDIQF